MLSIKDGIVFCIVAFSEKTTTAWSGGIKNFQIKGILL